MRQNRILTPPLDLAPEREIGARVGLRPYRPGGFVLRADRLPGGKPLIHNYGHGGSGYTLSWGCAEQAADLAAATGAKRFAVLGGGVIGLTTALTLLARGLEVTLYAEALHPEITSSVAGAVWGPTMVFDPGAADPAFLERFVRAACRTRAVLVGQIGDGRLGVQWVRKHSIGAAAPAMIDLVGADLYEGWRPEPALAARFEAASAISFAAPIVDPDLYLTALQEDLVRAGGRIVRRRFDTPAEVEALAEPAVVNCTGIGASALFGDTALAPIRGQVTLLKPEPEITYSYVVDPGFFYMYPRASSIVLGGTRELGAWSREIDPGVRARIRAGHEEIARKL
jgi:glycine/D-amino acid oxidase-like deaminating enzyme